MLFRGVISQKKFEAILVKQFSERLSKSEKKGVFLYFVDGYHAGTWWMANSFIHDKATIELGVKAIKEELNVFE